MAVDTTIHLIHDERRIAWQRKLIESIELEDVFDEVRRFYINLIDEEIQRVDDGEPCRGDLNATLVFPKSKPEIQAAAEQAMVLGLGKVIDKLMKSLITKYRLDEHGWFDQIDRDQCRLVVYEIVLRDYVERNTE